MERLIVPIEWKATEDDAGTLEGYASTFGNVDLGGDVVVPGAFSKTAKNVRANGVPLLADHMALTSSVLGTIFTASEDSRGLRFKARFSKAPSAQDVRIKLLEGHLSKMSIGYEAIKYAYEERDGRTVRLLQEIKLWEASVVVIPMNPEAVVSRVKSMSDDERKALADALRETERQMPPPVLVVDGKAVAEAVAAHEVADLTDPPADDAEAITDPDDESGTKPDEGDRSNEEAGDDPAEVPDEGTGWDRWASEAILHGADPDATASAAERAGLNTTSEYLAEWLASQTPEGQEP